MTAISGRWRLAAILIAAAALAAAFTAAGTPAPAPGSAGIEALWRDPGDITARDLRWGPGGQALAPSPATEFAFQAIDAVGYSAGYDVIDPEQREWDVKTGDEAQSEVVASRLLWAVGYRQPIVYFMPAWTLKNGPVPVPYPGRFRLDSAHAAVGEWSWTDNPFLGTRELKGLIVANLLINNWDMKTSNNRILAVPAARGPEQWFVVQDVGASFGKTAWPIGTRNRVADYETQKFVLGVSGGRVQFDYQGRRKELLEDLTAADVIWITGLFARLTDRQWADAFAAAAMPDDISARFIRKLKSKLQEGLALRAPGTEL